MEKFKKEKELIDMYKKGESVTNIASLFSINITTIYNIIKRNNIELKTGFYTSEEDIVKNYLETKSIRQTYRKYKTSFDKVKNILHKKKSKIVF